MRQIEYAIAFIVGLQLSFGDAKAATHYASALSESNVVYYSRNVADGDTVVFPSGAIGLTNIAYQSGSIAASVEWTNAVTLLFTAPTVITNMVSGADNPLWFTFRFSNPTGKDPAFPVRLSGATFHGNGRLGGILVSANRGNVRIDRCSFVNMRGTGVAFWGYNAFGVVDHCSFTNCQIAVRTYGGFDASWRQPLWLGTTNCVVYEDCLFHYDNDCPYVDMLSYNGQGSRTVFRHNLVVSTYTRGKCWFWDCHGNQAYMPIDHRGTIWCAVEDNVVNIKNPGRFFYIRGGMFMCVSNLLTCDTGGAIQLTEEEGWNSYLPGLLPLHANYPAQDQITNSWIVNSTINGQPITEEMITNYSYSVHPTDAVFIQHGRDFFVTNALPSETIYPRLAYPHPRVAAEDAGSHPPSAPQGLRTLTP